MMPCCVRLTAETSVTCGSMSPFRKPRSMTPRPPSSASTTAISARVMVSMFAETSGRCSVRCSEKRAEKSTAPGSRLGSTPHCGTRRKSSNVDPRTNSSKSNIDPPQGRRWRPLGRTGRSGPATGRAPVARVVARGGAAGARPPHETGDPERRQRQQTGMAFQSHLLPQVPRGARDAPPLELAHRPGRRPQLEDRLPADGKVP